SAQMRAFLGRIGSRMTLTGRTSGLVSSSFTDSPIHRFTYAGAGTMSEAEREEMVESPPSERAVEVPARRRSRDDDDEDSSRKRLLLVVPLLMAAAAIVALVLVGMQDKGITPSLSTSS